MAYTLGLDYGTNSVRALIVDCLTGNELCDFVYNYPSGTQGVILEPSNSNLARQHPGDYVEGIEVSIKGAIAIAREKEPEFSAQKIIGIGVDSTGSSPIPVNEKNEALGMLPEYQSNPNAQCWLWKDHTSHQEANDITRLALEHRPQYISRTGNVYSSEWWWSKIWHCANVDEAVFDAAYSWVELADWVPSILAGVTDPKAIKRGVCAAGHKAFFAKEWGGLPDKDFLTMLDPRLAELRDRLYDEAFDASAVAGTLSAYWAEKLGLTEGIAIAIGEFDVHYGAIGCGVDEGTLVKVIGTSTCDCAVVKAGDSVPDVPGICGIVNGSILPGYLGVEAGQSAVGDLFKWWVEGVCEGDDSLHGKLTDEASKLKPGQSGLLSLDWNNGNRTVLVDQRLTGLILGQTLHTSRAEIYRALIEATAFGARKILERIEEHGIPVKRIVCAGGIAEKNPMLMQIYADILGREMLVAGSSQACALGAAIGAAVAAGKEVGGFASFDEAKTVMSCSTHVSYQPDSSASIIYNSIYDLYQKIHDAFGGVDSSANLSVVMKELMTIREQVSRITS